MAIRVRVAGVFLGHPLNRTFEEPYIENDTPKKVFARLDKKKALGRRFFKGLVKQGRATFLLNGDRLDIPERLDNRLSEGDEISVLSAIAGG
jgi:molybdopterin converting factor small subunit